MQYSALVKMPLSLSFFHKKKENKVSAIAIASRFSASSTS
jgi:hypothetical protein